MDQRSCLPLCTPVAPAMPRESAPARANGTPLTGTPPPPSVIRDRSSLVVVAMRGPWTDVSAGGAPPPLPLPLKKRASEDRKTLKRVQSTVPQDQGADLTSHIFSDREFWPVVGAQTPVMLLLTTTVVSSPVYRRVPCTLSTTCETPHKTPHHNS